MNNIKKYFLNINEYFLDIDNFVLNTDNTRHNLILDGIMVKISNINRITQLSPTIFSNLPSGLTRVNIASFPSPAPAPAPICMLDDLGISTDIAIFNERNNNFNVDDKVLVNIFTDGGNNNSWGKYSSDSFLSEYLKNLETEGFTVTFQGTKQEVLLSVGDSAITPIILLLKFITILVTL